MIFNVPQFVNIEDKIVGPLGWKEIFWMMGMGTVLMIFWGILDRQAFIFAAIPTISGFGALAFYKPYGQPLIKVIFFVITYFFRPRVYVWKREPMIPKKKVAPTPVAPTEQFQEKKVSEEEIMRLAGILNARSRSAEDKRNQ